MIPIFLLAVVIIAMIIYAKPKDEQQELQDLAGFYEIEPSFSYIAGIETMTIILSKNSGEISFSEKQGNVIVHTFDIKDNVFVSEDEHPILNKKISLKLDNSGLLTITDSNGVILGVFVKDNMISLHLKK
jgi:hypothetical protein